MDVYVLTEDHVILGVANRLDIAEEIADRRGSMWNEWHDGRTPGEWIRWSMQRHPGAMQRIIRVPLAMDMPVVLVPALTPDWAGEIAEIGRQYGAP
jgi:hypothetical protein